MIDQTNLRGNNLKANSFLMFIVKDQLVSSSFLIAQPHVSACWKGPCWGFCGIYRS